MKNKKGNVTVIALIIVIVAITAGFVGWMFAKKSQAPVQQTVVSQPIQVAQTQSAVQPLSDKFAGWQMYKNDVYDYEIQYPSDWKVEYTRIDDVSINAYSADVKGDYVVLINVAKKSDRSIRTEDVKEQGFKNIRDIMIDGVKGFAYDVDPTPKQSPGGSVYVVDMNDYEYQISISYNSSKPLSNDTGEKMLSSFKFTN